MELIRLTDGADPRYARARALYKRSFPFHEQREERSQLNILGAPEYQYLLIYDGDLWVGLMLCWETETFIYVEHFCTFPELRGQGYGRRALEVLGRRGKTVILEIDPPADPVSIRRKGFYERCGYVANPFPHVHPPYHRGVKGHDLVVMSCPKALGPREYEEFALVERWYGKLKKSAGFEAS